MAQPPLYKINKGSKSVYIKDEKELENYILKNSKELTNIKKDQRNLKKSIKKKIKNKYSKI